jgi:hypothetical protein
MEAEHHKTKMQEMAQGLYGLLRLDQLEADDVSTIYIRLWIIYVHRSILHSKSGPTVPDHEVGSSQAIPRGRNHPATCG